MEEATVIGCLVCFTGTSRSKTQQPNRLLLKSASSKIELLPSYEKLSKDPSPVLTERRENMPHRMPQDDQGTDSSSDTGAEREEGGERIMKRPFSWLPDAKGKRWPIQGWA